MAEATNIIKSRKFRVIAEIKKRSWEDLGLVQPEITEEEELEATGLTVDELYVVKGLKKPTTEE